uniref:Putative ATPase domain containing protein n=1 Tax=viral metagenome TaxID=1070528 RepID=A0A6M3L9E7_9ZZZZ
MALAKEPSKTEGNPQLATMLIYGEPGIGKTTMASQMEGAYFLATEQGHKFKQVYKSDIVSWDEFRNEVRLLLKGDHAFRTIVVDTISGAWEMCVEQMCKDKGLSHISDMAMGKGYDLAKNMFRSVISALYGSPYGLVFIAHDTEKEMEYRGIKKHRVVPSFIKTCRDVVIPTCDFIGHMYVENIMDTKKGTMAPRRLISFSPNPEKDSKDRSGILAREGPIIAEPEDQCWERVREIFTRHPETKETKEAKKGTET